MRQVWRFENCCVSKYMCKVYYIETEKKSYSSSWPSSLYSFGLTSIIVIVDIRAKRTRNHITISNLSNTPDMCTMRCEVCETVRLHMPSVGDDRLVFGLCSVNHSQPPSFIFVSKSICVRVYLMCACVCVCTILDGNRELRVNDQQQQQKNPLYTRSLVGAMDAFLCILCHHFLCSWIEWNGISGRMYALLCMGWF